ncbi:MAG: PIN domain-containing protein [Promethearchaeota archaeon]
MRKSLVAIDSSCLIAIQTDEKMSEKLKELLNSEWEGYCTEMAIVETYYILCRKTSFNIAKNKIESLIESNIIEIVEINDLVEIAVKLKCNRAISIADCFTIALAKFLNGKAIFFKKELELEKTMEIKPFDIEIIFFKEDIGV